MERFILLVSEIDTAHHDAALKLGMSDSAILVLYTLCSCGGECMLGDITSGASKHVNMIFLAIFIGYSIGVSPVVGYHYGAENHSELKGLLRKSCVIIGIFAAAMFGLAELLAGTLAGIFVGYDRELMEMTVVFIAVKREKFHY